VFSFITKRSFLFNFILALILALAAVFIFFQLLDQITHHGDYIKVIDVKGKTYAEAKKLLEAQGFDVVVQDSAYDATIPILSVIKQSPDVNEMVKINRTIYLSINRSQPPMVKIPNFVGQTFRSVKMQLTSLGLVLGDTTYKPDFAVGSILEQSINGNTLLPGTSVPMGTEISLVIGGGINQDDMAVPSLIGMTFSEARAYLDSNGLLLGAVVKEGAIRDSSNAFVIKQNPPKRDEEGRPIRIRQGQLVDLWISNEKTAIDSLKND
jgi:eukaryotic-like serine/threonine-protein kinase